MDKAAALEKAVTSKTTSIHRFVHNSATRPGMPPISVNPGSRAIFTQPPEIIVHDIKDRAEQDKVIAAVQAVMRDQKLTRVDLQFMDKENWIVTNYPNPSVARLQASAKGVQSCNSGESVYHKDMCKKTAARKRSRICRRSYSDATAKASNRAMKPTAHCETTSACLPRHPAVAYLFRVR